MTSTTVLRPRPQRPPRARPAPPVIRWRPLERPVPPLADQEAAIASELARADLV
jgi:hypothetical protein